MIRPDVIPNELKACLTGILICLFAIIKIFWPEVKMLLERILR